MSTITHTAHHAQEKTHNNHDEMILVVKRDYLFPHESWEGLRTDKLTHCLEAIASHSEFHPRARMEEDPTYKQIIPYLIFQHKDTFFLMQRRENASESRLQNKYSLGIGGHMRLEDLQQGPDLFAWAKREFQEEVSYDGNLEIVPVGVLNDDSNSVGQVHLGLVLMLCGDSANIRVKSELKNGQLLSLIDCFDYVHKMETWSQIAFMEILKRGISMAQE
jgi:predicted NUDIX family phosphoesterase